ncbi:RDD family protein [Dermatobacter hominis]|nr:RDD family protein [Dermatobacter hominis]
MLASPGKRIGGFLIDFVIMVIINIPVAIVLFLVLAQTSTDSFGNTYRADLGIGGQLLINLVSTLIWAAYHIGFVAVKGQTPGAMLVKVKVVRLADGQIPGGGPATLRVLPNFVGLIPCLGIFLSIGLWIWALVNLFSNERRQTPFDLAAKTVVIDVA